MFKVENNLDLGEKPTETCPKAWIHVFQFQKMAKRKNRLVKNGPKFYNNFIEIISIALGGPANIITNRCVGYLFTALLREETLSSSRSGAVVQ